MSQLDIIARLSLRAEQFSSEAGRAAADVSTKMGRAAAEIRKPFVDAFAEVNRLAQTALALPRTQTGSLDLSSEIAQLRASASAADIKAQGLRELSIAQTAAAGSAQIDAQAMRAEADAAAVGALAEERNATAIRGRIVALEAVQRELSQTTSQTRMLSNSTGAYSVSAGQARASTMMLGQQAQDFFIMVEGGQGVVRAFTSQVGQMAFAVQGMGGRLAGVGAFLASGWGTAVLIGLTVLTPLVAKMFEHNAALDDALDKLKKNAAETAAADAAHAAFAKTIEGEIDIQRKLTEELDRQLNTQRQLQQIKIGEARQNLENSRGSRTDLLGKISAQRGIVQGYKDQLKTPGMVDPEAMAGVLAASAAAEAQLKALQEQLRLIETSIVASERNVRAAELPLLQSDVEVQFDKNAAAARRYTIELGKLNQQYKIGEGKTGVVDLFTADGKSSKATLAGIGEAEYKRRLASITKERDDAIARAAKEKADAAKVRREAERTMILAAPVTGPVSSGFGQRAAPRLTNGGRGSSDHPAIDYAVPTGTSVKAGADGIVVYSGTLGGYGKVTIVDYGNGTFGQFNHLSETLKKPGDAVASGDVIARTGATGNVSGAHLDYRVRTGARFEDGRLQGGQFVDPRSRVKVGSPGDAAANAEDRAAKAMAEQAQMAERIRDSIERQNASWDEQPKLIDRARLDTAKLNDQIAWLKEFRPEGWEEMAAQAERTKQLITEGINRPFEQFVKSQRESLAIGALTLEGRDAEANALQDALRIQEQQGRISDEQLATVIAIAQQQERILRAIEDQRRVVGIYTRSVGDLQNTFEQFLTDGNIGKAAGGIIENVKQVQRSLLSNAIFGGVDRAVEDYVRKITGRKTPAEILAEQASGAGTELHARVSDAGDALSDFVKMVRGASANLQSGGSDAWAGDVVGGRLFDPANDNDSEIVVTGVRTAAEYFKGEVLEASGVFGVAVDGVIGNLERLGIQLPKGVTDAMKKYLPSVFEGVAFGQMGGSVFSSLTGGRENKLGSSIGGVLGDVTGKALGKLIPETATGLLKTLGGAAGPIGAVVGGILGNLVGGLLTKPNWSNATVTLNQFGEASGTLGTGRGGDAIAAATGTASSVASGINAIADQLGATIRGLPALTLGTWNERYRVATVSTTRQLHSNNFGPDVLHDFGDDQQAAIEFAVRYSIANGVIDGISAASQSILRSGQDLQSAISKALMIEAIPKDLKAMLDPVGAALDELNRKWKHTVDALREGGATAAQMAQAERLYNLQLEETRNSTQAASSTLREYRDSLMLGSSSAYSLRDQEATALNRLQPYLDQIAAGQSVDQDRYREAAQAYLDVERDLYGSTQSYFDALDTVQAATNRAITAIENVEPITAPVENPFVRATAESAARTAQGVQTGNEMAEDTNALLARNNELMTQILASMGEVGGGFIGSDRLFSRM